MKVINFNESINKFQEAIDNTNQIILTCHENPDGDAIGSTNALAILLEELGYFVHVIYPEPLPEKFNFLQFPTSWENLPKDTEEGDTLCRIDCTDTVITLDSSDENRVKGVLSQLKYRQLINIDHHPTNTFFGDVNLVDDQASSTCELLYKIFKLLSKPFNYGLAKNLYTGIVTDTGSFKYENVSSDTFAASQELLVYGVKPYEISREIFERMSINLFYFIRDILNDLQMTDDGKIAWIFCPRQLMNQYQLDDSDIEGVITYPRSLDSVEFAVIFKETPEGSTKVSLRSKTLDVSVVASELGGGGHIRAAGCLLNDDMNRASQIVLDRLKRELIAQTS